MPGGAAERGGRLGLGERRRRRCCRSQRASSRPSSTAWARPRLTTMPTCRTAATIPQRARQPGASADVRMAPTAVLRSTHGASRRRTQQPSLFATLPTHRRPTCRPPTRRWPSGMRPRTLDEFVGQGIWSATQRLLRDMIEGQRLHSLILWGPPGSGKTSLARLIARSTQAQLHRLLGGAVGRQGAARRRRRGARRAARGAAARSSSSTRSIASTRRSRTPSCRTSKTARSC